MAPPRTGSVEPRGRGFVGRIRVFDGGREWVKVPADRCTPAGGMTGRDRAEIYAQAVQEREDELGENGPVYLARKARLDAKAATKAGEETCSKYRERLDEYRAKLGRRMLRYDRSSWSKWIAPRIGHLPIAKVTRDDVERVRDALDEAITLHRETEGREGIGPKRARNVWTVVTSTFKAACASKRKDLRVRVDNPCAGVLPPERGESRRRTFIFPNEMRALLACRDVPLEWREAYALGCYLYLRPGELRALTVGDVDLDAGVIHVTRAWDEDADEVKPPKTRNGVRDVPIHPNLRPLLARIVEGKESGAYVAPVIADRSSFERARTFRAHLAKAKVTRARLTENNATAMHVGFRSLRDSGITWLALAGVDVTKIMRRAGHDDVSTSMGYVKQAEDLSGTIGEPFPPLPPGLIGPSIGPLGHPPPEFLGEDGVPRGIRSQGKSLTVENHATEIGSHDPRVDPTPREMVPDGPRSVHDATASAVTIVDLAAARERNEEPSSSIVGSEGAAAIAAISKAICAATDAGRWDLVERLTAVLERIAGSEGTRSRLG